MCGGGGGGAKDFSLDILRGDTWHRVVIPRCLARSTPSKVSVCSLYIDPILCFHSDRTASPAHDLPEHPTATIVCPAQFLANDDVHMVFSGDGEEETGPAVARGRLPSDAYIPLQRLTSKMDADQTDVVIVEDEEERQRVTAQRIRERRERMNNEIRRLRHFNNTIGGTDNLGAPIKGHSQPSGEGYLGQSMCQPRPPPPSGTLVHRSFSVPGRTLGELNSSAPGLSQRDFGASGFGLQPLPEKDLPVVDEEGSGDLESLDLNSIPENEVNFSDCENSNHL